MAGGEQEADTRPGWARRLRAERIARGWSQADAVRALRAHSPVTLPADPTLIRNWKRWEAGGTEPDDFYRPLLARTVGTVTGSLFAGARRAGRDAEVLTATGMGTMEVLARLQSSAVDGSTLDAVRITTERLCSEYPYTSPEQLRADGQEWLGRITRLIDGCLTLRQHREVLALAGWLALLVGCVEWDLGLRRAAETTRLAAHSLGAEAEHPEIVGWAHEMRAWFALTQGDYRAVIAASEAGRAEAPHHGVSVQLAGQQAKAWARIGDRRQVEAALDRGRALLETLPYPDNLDNHFVVDPAKFDFYAMDCYRLLREDRLAETYAHQVIENGTAVGGLERSPMRNAEARITLGVVAARGGDTDEAVRLGTAALDGERSSLPSLLMCSRELASVLRRRHPDSPDAVAYLDRLRALAAA